MKRHIKYFNFRSKFQLDHPVQSSAHVSSYVVDHSNSLGNGESKRNYYPAKKEGRNYDRKEELLEELIDLLSESIHHRNKDKASWAFLHSVTLQGTTVLAKRDDAP